MKRLWLGTALLVLIFILALLSGEFMDTTHTPSAQNLEQAAHLAQAGDWNQARALSKQAQARWNRTRTLTAALAEHDTTEEAEALFAQISVYAAAENSDAFSATCIRLSCILGNLSGSHRLTLENLL